MKRLIFRPAPMRNPSSPLSLATLLLGLLLTPFVVISVAAAPESAGPGTIQTTADAASPPACHHDLPPPKPGQKPYQRLEQSYRIPDLNLVGMDGQTVRLQDALDQQRPVMLNFIFTTCNTICPVLSATFAEVQKGLGEDRGKVAFVSISIDPEQDTPARLRAYADKYGADRDWQFLTGDLAQIVTVQRAFDAYRGNKLNHLPLTFLRLAPGAAWVRIEGFAKATDLIQEYRDLQAQVPDGSDPEAGAPQRQI